MFSKQPLFVIMVGLSANLNLKGLDLGYISKLAKIQDIYVTFHCIETWLRNIIRTQIVWTPWVSESWSYNLKKYKKKVARNVASIPKTLQEKSMSKPESFHFSVNFQKTNKLFPQDTIITTTLKIWCFQIVLRSFRHFCYSTTMANYMVSVRRRSVNFHH